MQEIKDKLDAAKGGSEEKEHLKLLKLDAEYDIILAKIEKVEVQIKNAEKSKDSDKVNKLKEELDKLKSDSEQNRAEYDKQTK